MLQVQNLSVSIGDSKIVNDISFTVPQGSWLMIAGPNGAGKSTLARAVSQGLPYSGKVLFEGDDLKKVSASALAKKIGMLEQTNHIGYSFTVEEIVRLGRYAYRRSPFSKAPAGDEEAIAKALEYTGLYSLKDRLAPTLSGGELQRVFLAQLFAQDPQLLILDEPTNHLDLVYQKQVLELVKEWIKDTGRSVISVVHDLSLAKAYGDNALLLSGGNVVDFGNANAVLSDNNLDKVYGMPVRPWMKQLLSQWE